jgi:hypothetical protein
MAILSAGPRWSRPVALLAALGTLVLGCSIGRRLGLSGDDQPALAFSHALHHGQEGLDCIACHTTYDSEEEAGMPVLGQCMLCHADLDAEKPPERQIAALFEGEVYRAQRISALSSEIVFSHPAHAVDAELCGTCHEGIEESERLDERMAVSMDDCTSCHDRLGIANECSTCHAEIREDRAPLTHQLNWTRTHGLVFRAGSQATANRCDLCHTEQSCNQCHQSVPPDNHTNHWRRRGHGITARMDRQNCDACHRTDVCASCHAEMEPQNHVGMWGSPQNRHCLSCHIGTSEGGCFVCHTGTPSHGLALPQPPDHTPGMNCLQCHGISAPLPHVHKGEDCTICHP